MERDDIEGAKAAAEYVLALYPYVYVTGDLDIWRELSHPDCNFCSSVLANVRDLHADGGYVDGPAVDVLHVEVAGPNQMHEYYAVSVDVSESAHAYYDEQGSIVDTFEGSHLAVDMALQHDRASWLIRAVTVKDADSGA